MPNQGLEGVKLYENLSNFSIDGIRTETIDDFNTYLEGLQVGSAADNTVFSLIQFDTSGTDIVHLYEAVKKVPKLDKTTYVPRHGTPLLEAEIKTIEAVEKAHKPEDRPPVICFMTDGQENASGPEYTLERLNKLVKEKTALGWQFNFMGVGIDAYAQAAAMGISVGSTISTSMNPKERRTAYAASAQNTAMYAAGARADTSYTAVQKMASGDSFAPDLGKPAKTPWARPSATMPRPVATSTTSPKKDIVDDLDLTK